MSVIQALILGVVQGLTEFLPVSSSGHLVLAERILGVPAGDLSFEIVLHLATMAAVCLAYRRKLWKLARAVLRARVQIHKGRLRIPDENLRLFLYLVLATVPAAAVGYLLRDAVERAFASPLAASIGLLATGGILFATRWTRDRNAPMDWRRALTVGMAQAAAILPGVSRSGSTMAAAVYTGVRQEKAAEFSFLLSVPIILGAGIFELKDAALTRHGDLGPLVVGGLAAGICGFLAIKWLLAVVRRNRLEHFAYYCWLAGALGVVLTLTR
jgi:undecaprenyl-diphosphatase